jgi:hypothetical protein
MVCLTIGVTTIENGLHPVVLLAVPVVIWALARRDYEKPLFWNEKIFTAIFLIYVIALSLVLISLRMRFWFPVFMVYFSFGTVMVRILSPLTNRSISQLIFLSVGMILVNCILTNHILFGALLPIYLFFLMGTLLLFHLAKASAPAWAFVEPHPQRRASDLRYGTMARYLLIILALTCVVFVLFPRPFAFIPGFRGGLAGAGRFADLRHQISYRDMAEMPGLNRVAFMAIFEQGLPTAAPYWRGRVLEGTDGRSWFSSSWPHSRPIFVRANPSEVITYKVLPYRLQSNVVYIYGLPLQAWGRRDQQLLINRLKEVVIDSAFLLSNSYTVKAVRRPVPADSRIDPLYLEPGPVTPRIADLAGEWTRGARTRREKAEALLAGFRSGFTYKLRVAPPPEEVNPLEYFLFESRTGNCEYFAGAMGLMLRAVGVPSRLVEGFLGLEKTSVPNEFLVRFRNAHAWVEAVLDDSNWALLDPTPPTALSFSQDILDRLVDLYDQVEYEWIKLVVNFDRLEQLKLLQMASWLLTGKISMPFSLISKFRPYMAAAAVVGGMMILAVILFSWGKRRASADLSRIYVGTMKAIVRKGILDRVDPWHEENIRVILKNAPEVEKSLKRFMGAYLRARFGGKDTGAWHDVRKAARELVDAVSKRALAAHRS